MDYWYFELVEMIRKLLMTAILIFLFPGTPAQIISGLVLSLVFLYIYMLTMPFRDPELDHLQISTLVAQHCTLICKCSFALPVCFRPVRLYFSFFLP